MKGENKIVGWMEQNGLADYNYYIKNEQVFVVDEQGEVIEKFDLEEVEK